MDGERTESPMRCEGGGEEEEGALPREAPLLLFPFRMFGMEKNMFWRVTREGEDASETEVAHQRSRTALRASLRNSRL